MSKITPFLWFDNNLEQAVNFYSEVFKNSKVHNISRMGEGGPVFSAVFELEGQTFMGMNAGPIFKFNEAVSFFVSCEDQQEIDYYWGKLTSNGGQESRCGWLKDQFGLSWQIVPKVLGSLIGGPDPARAKNAMEAMLQMGKLDIKKLEDAYNS